MGKKGLTSRSQGIAQKKEILLILSCFSFVNLKDGFLNDHSHLAQIPCGASPALAQLLVLRLEHVELLGEADDDHEEQQDNQSRGAHGQTHHLELGHHRLAAGTLVPDVILDITSEAEDIEERERERGGGRGRKGKKNGCLRKETEQQTQYGDMEEWKEGELKGKRCEVR